MVSKSEKIILRISAIFPLDFFPDYITVDEIKVNIIQKDLFGADFVHSVLLENISNVTVSAELFFASIRIIDSTNPRAPITLEVHNLRKKDAFLTRRVIQGLITAKKAGVNLSEYDNVIDLRKKLESLGTTRQTANPENLSSPMPQKIPDQPYEHYYGDTTRKLFFIIALIMLTTLPFFYDLIPYPLPFSIITIALLALQSGIINPKSMSIAFVNLISSLFGFIVFEYLAVSSFVDGTHIWFFITDQILALLSFTALYFSTKTFRGFLNRS